MEANSLQDVPLHFSRFFPRYRMTDAESTPRQTLTRARDIALSFGIKSVYLGNI
jgi:pyruvate formate lyase activating enzyme